MAGSKTFVGRFVAADEVPYLVLISRVADREEIEEITLGADAVRISYESEDKLSPIVASKAEVHVISVRDGQFADLYSLSGRDVELVVLRGEQDGWAMVWRGAIDPEYYEEPYTSPDSYIVTLRFGDLGSLKRIKWTKERARLKPADLISSILTGLPRVPVSGLLPQSVKGIADSTTKTSLSSSTSVVDGRGILEHSLVDTRIWERADKDALTHYEVLEGLLRCFALRLEVRGGEAKVYDLETLRRMDGVAISSRGADAMMLADKVYSEVRVSTPLHKDKVADSSTHEELPSDGAIVLPRFGLHGQASARLSVRGDKYTLRPVTAGKESSGVIMFYDPTQTQGVYSAGILVDARQASPKDKPIGGGLWVKQVISGMIATPSTKGERYGLDGASFVYVSPPPFDGAEVRYSEKFTKTISPAIYPSFFESRHIRDVLGYVSAEVRNTKALMRAQVGAYSRVVLSHRTTLPPVVGGRLAIGCDLLIGLSPSLAEDADEAGTNLVSVLLEREGEPLQWAGNPQWVGERDSAWRANNARLKVKVTADNGRGDAYSLKQILDPWNARSKRIKDKVSTTIDTATDRGDYMRYEWVREQAQPVDLQYGYKGYNFGRWTKPNARWWDMSNMSEEDQSKISPPTDYTDVGMLIPAPPASCTHINLSVLDAFVMDYTNPDVRSAVKAGVAAPTYVLVRQLSISPVITDDHEEDDHEESYTINSGAYEPTDVQLDLTTEPEAESASPSHLLHLDGTIISTPLVRTIEVGDGQVKAVRGTVGELYARSVASQYGGRGRIIEGTYSLVFGVKPIELRGEKYIRTREEISLRDARGRMTLALLNDDKEVKRAKKLSKPKKDEDRGLRDLEERERLIREIVGPVVRDDVDKAKGDIGKQIDTAKGVLEGLINDTNNRSIGRARIESTRALREQVSIERDRAYETYLKLRTDKRTPKDKGLALEQAWITANGAHAALYGACNTAISTPSDANITTLVTRTREYKTAMVSLQRTIQEVEQAIREDVYNEARGKSYAKLDATALDPNKWYPITMRLNIDRQEIVYGLKLTRSLFHGGGSAQEWWGHREGYHFCLQWSVRGQGWGQRREDRRIYSYYHTYLREGTPVVSTPRQITEGSVEYVYVRGGSIYEVEVTGLTNVEIQIHPEGYEWRTSPGNDTYLRRLPVLESIGALGEPKVDLDVLSDRLLAEIARERGELQRAIQAAQSSSSAALEARVQGVLAQVSQLEGLMRDGQAVLQRQIDRQVERWYGSEIAQSGVPPTSLWAATDNAKHEGDTYTCVAPRGVTITPDNAQRYPNVGRSWRWTNGGSGTAYGWELIADTDITQALALASRAQATADGKMTHYITPTPPVTYQQGDQWTLPAPWQGRKDGRAYTYPAGSILTATADSISGQHHPEHWVELVRYTDLSLEDIMVGWRNLVRDSKGRRVVEPSDTSRFNAVGYRLTTGYASTHKAYAVSANVEVLAGDIDYITAYIYGAHAPQRARYDRAKGGVQRLTWVFGAELSDPVKETRHPLYIYAGVNGETIGNSIAVSEIIVVEGNMPPQSWTPAPEDVQAEIESKARELQRSIDAANAAIRTAKDAADAAKRQADTAKSAAQANDGKIDEAESRGIAKAVQAYQQALQVEWERLKAGYEALKASEYLAEKTALTSAYSTAKQRYDTLTAKITAILTDAKVRAEEYSQYVTAYNAYQPTAKVLADAIETASKAVQAELLKRADEAAKGRVDAIKLGGRNLARRTATDRWQMWGSGRITCTPPVIRIERGNGASNSVFAANQSDKLMRLRSGQTYTLSYWAKGNATPNYCYIMCNGVPNQHVARTLKGNVSETEWSLIVMQIDVSERTASANGCGVMIGCLVQEDRRAWLEIKDVMLEEGNKPSAWTPAPEDVTEEAERKADEAERRAKEHADAKAIAESEARAKLAKSLQTQEERVAGLEYLKAVIAKGKQQAMKVKNGAVVVPLLLNNYLGILDLEGKLRAYLSGDRAGGVFLAAGLDDQGIPNVEIMHRGGARFGQLYLLPNGIIEAKTRADAEAYVRFGGRIPALAQLLGRTGVGRTITAANGYSLQRGYVDSTSSVGAVGQLSEQSSATLQNNIAIEDGYRVRIRGRLNLSALAHMESGTTGEARAEASIALYMQDSAGHQTVIHSSYVYMLTRDGMMVSNEGTQASNKEIDVTITIPPATYDLRVEGAVMFGGATGSATYVRTDISDVSISLESIADYNYTAFGDNGFTAIFGSGSDVKYLHVSPTEQAYITTRGDLDMSGVLLSGVSRYATQSLSRLYNPRGSKRSVSVRHQGTNEVVLTHNLGHDNYSVSVTPIYESGMEDRPYIVQVVAQTSTYIRVKCWRQWGSSTNAQRCAFSFIFTGSNF